MLANTGPGRNSKSALLTVVDRDAGDVAGQQVGGELQPTDRAVDGAGQRLRQRGLADPGHVLDQQVPFGEQGHERDPDDLGLADQHAFDVGGDPPHGVVKLVETDGRDRTLVTGSVGAGGAVFTGVPVGGVVRLRGGTAVARGDGGGHSGGLSSRRHTTSWYEKPSGTPNALARTFVARRVRLRAGRHAVCQTAAPAALPPCRSLSLGKRSIPQQRIAPFR
jgi:hypothetical protein